MSKRQIERRVKNGISEVLCTCGKWIPDSKANESLCYKCFRERKREHFRTWYKRQKEKLGIESNRIPEGLKSCIVDIYSAGFSCYEIESMLGIHYSTVWTIVKKAGVGRNSRQAYKLARSKGKKNGILFCQVRDKQRIQGLAELIFSEAS